MRKFLFSPGVLVAWLLWLVELGMQVGGWTNQVAARVILGIALLGVVVALVYYLVGRKRLRPSGERIGVSDSVSIEIKTASPIPVWEFHTRNEKGRRVGDQIKGKHKIQSIRFVEPVEMIIKEGELPKVVNLETKLAKRLVNFLFRASPTIIVKKFMGEEILFDEEFTHNEDVKIEFYLVDEQV